MLLNPLQDYLTSDAGLPDSPALLIFPEMVKKNIGLAVSMVKDVTFLQPHTKTHKTKEAAAYMLSAGITRFKCATIAEAEMLGECQAPQVLLAYQPVGPKAERFVHLIKKYPGTQYACLVDNIPQAEKLSALFNKNGLIIPVYIDLNVGMNRTGIVPGDAALELYLRCHALNGLSMAGLHAYDGHIRHRDFDTRTTMADEAFAKVEKLVAAIVQSGLPEPSIIAGGSHSFPVHARRENVICSPGTFVFWDQHNTNWCPEQPFAFAALLLTRIVSLPDATRICVDLGHKSVAAENPLAQRVYFPGLPHLQPVGQSEEHLVLEAGPGHGYKVGDALIGIPEHVCPTIALYEKAFCIDHGNSTGEWTITARDRYITV